MSKPATPPPHIIVGNPDNRRVTAYVEALAGQGHPAPRVFAHADLVAAPERLLEVPDTPHVLRVDTTGEDAGVERQLLALGFDPDAGDGAIAIPPDGLARRPQRHGEVLAPRQAHRGLERYLTRLATVIAQRPSWRVVQPFDDVLELFDKRRTSQRWSAAGIPVPDALRGADAPETPDDLLAAMVARGWPSVFLKVSCASSASCLAVLNRASDGRLSLRTTLKRAGEPAGWFNTLKVQRVDDRAAIAARVAFILGEGAHVERHVPKAKLDGAFFDMRIVAVAGEPAFWVVRQARHPITNLHLGGWRGDPEALQRAAGAGWEAALATCRRVAGMYGTHHLGIDLLFEPGLQRHRVIEANAFGDLLPRLTRDGLSLYAWEITALQNNARTTA